jgi:hypothetical protein
MFCFFLKVVLHFDTTNSGFGTYTDSCTSCYQLTNASLYILKKPVPVATTYPEIPYQIETSLFPKKLAQMQMPYAVWPDGKELAEEPSDGMLYYFFSGVVAATKR